MWEGWRLPHIYCITRHEYFNFCCVLVRPCPYKVNLSCSSLKPSKVDSFCEFQTVYFSAAFDLELDSICTADVPLSKTLCSTDRNHILHTDVVPSGSNAVSEWPSYAVCACVRACVRACVPPTIEFFVIDLLAKALLEQEIRINWNSCVRVCVCVCCLTQCGSVLFWLCNHFWCG